MSAATGSPRLALSTVCLSGTLEDKLRAAGAAGFSDMEVLEYDLLMSSWSPHRLAEEAAGLGLSLTVYQPFHVETVPPDRFGETLRHAEQKFGLLAELGAGVLVCCSSRTTEGLDDDDLTVQQLSMLADRAHSHGLRLAYEAVPWGRLRTHEDALRIVRRVDHPALGLCLDSFHALSLRNDPGVLDDIPVDRVFHVQLADAPRPDMDIREWSLHQRMFPGQGSLRVADLLRRLLDMGYSGPMAIEVFNDVYQQEDPRHAATDAMRAMLAVAEEVGAPDLVHAPGRPHTALPPAPALTGFAFAELAVDGVSAPLVSRVLAALGFTHVGQHRSKPVQLWEQSGARVLLNLAPQRSIIPATASICALAVGSSAPAASMARAERLLAPKLPRPRRPDESDLNSVATPDGTALFFCDTGPEEGWLADFAPTGESATAPPLLGAIDHVSTTESIDDFDQSTLFFRTVLGLVPRESTEITAPFGVIRSWSASDTDERVRISLSTNPLRRGDWAPGIPSPQIVAFSTDDAIACAKLMRKRGAPLLEMPGNYYDDLGARLSLSDELVEAMREQSILYDRDEHGQYLHFFTEMVGSRVSFEIVQRIDGYRGSGAAHSIPLRMAAHRRQRLRVLASAPTEASAEHRHDYSLAHLTALSLSPPELVDAAAAAGYRYVGCA